MWLKISEFAHLSRVSARMLRHYDRVGLLKPICVDPATSYRYYSSDQLPRLNMRHERFSTERIMYHWFCAFMADAYDQIADVDPLPGELRQLVG